MKEGEYQDNILKVVLSYWLKYILIYYKILYSNFKNVSQFLLFLIYQ